KTFSRRTATHAIPHHNRRPAGADLRRVSTEPAKNTRRNPRQRYSIKTFGLTLAPQSSPEIIPTRKTRASLSNSGVLLPVVHLMHDQGDTVIMRNFNRNARTLALSAT